MQYCSLGHRVVNFSAVTSVKSDKRENGIFDCNTTIRRLAWKSTMKRTVHSGAHVRSEPRSYLLCSNTILTLV